MQLNSPVSDSKIERLIDTVDLTSESRAVDFGCGNGEFLIRLYKKSRASCLGVDIDASNVAVANKKLNDLPGASVEFRQSDAKTVSLDNESFDLTVCMGSSHAFAEGKSAYESAIAFMQKALKKKWHDLDWRGLLEERS